MNRIKEDAIRNAVRVVVSDLPADREHLSTRRGPVKVEFIHESGCNLFTYRGVVMAGVPMYAEPGVGYFAICRDCASEFATDFCVALDEIIRVFRDERLLHMYDWTEHESED